MTAITICIDICFSSSNQSTKHSLIIYSTIDIIVPVYSHVIFIYCICLYNMHMVLLL